MKQPKQNLRIKKTLVLRKNVPGNILLPGSLLSYPAKACPWLLLVAIAKMASKFHINQRLSYLAFRCTVRYIGSVEGTHGEWLGVEWDTLDKGKHSGEYQGKKYFECL